MTKREDRLIGAFINCVGHGEFSEDYAVTLIEDSQRYGWLSEEAKEVFYDWLDSRHADPDPEPVPEAVTEPEPEGEGGNDAVGE